MNHLEQIAAALEARELDAMLVTSAPGEFYAVGFRGEGAVVVTRTACRYITDSRYIEAARRQVTGAEVVVTSRGRGQRALAEQAVRELSIRRMGFEDGYMTVAEHENWQAALPCELVPAQSVLTALRSVKDEEELARMTRAQAITDQVFAGILEFIRPGMTERQVAARLQYDMLCLGAERMSFDPIVASGPNGSMPHAVPGDRKVREGDFITMDFGCVAGGYCSDMTRTVALGTPTEEMRRVYELVLAAQRAGIAAARAGATGRTIDGAARRVIEEAGYGEYFGHSFGHGLGLEIHEAPNASYAEEKGLPAGAVISAEPGIYLPGRFGVRIEDVLVLTPEGCADLTGSSKELIIL